MNTEQPDMRLEQERVLRGEICRTQLLAACTWTPPEFLRSPGRDGMVPTPINFPCLPPPPAALLAEMGALPGGGRLPDGRRLPRRQYLRMLLREWHPEDVGKTLTLTELCADQAVLENRRIRAISRIVRQTSTTSELV